MGRPQSLQEYSQLCVDMHTTDQVWQGSLAFFHSRGVEMVSYHCSDGLGEQSAAIQSDGYPREWACRYVERNLVAVDPAPDLAHVLARPFWWSDIESLMDLLPEQKRFMEDVREAKLGDGLAIPVFGPNLRNAYVGLGFGTEKPVVTSMEVFELQCAAQISHMRYCELTTDHVERKIELSPREREVLTWIAKGKSNSVIADILGISNHTVDTLIRRLFHKLQVNDRTTAAILGVGSGLVHVRPV